MIHSVIRRFLPVGQGAFYLEQFKGDDRTYNVVYDCGSSTDIELVKNQIRSNFEKKQIVDAVFISHIDADHVNGLEYLMKYCHVKNIILPYTMPSNSNIIKLEYLCSNDNVKKSDFVYRLIENPQAIFKNREIRLYYVINNESDLNQDNNEYSEHYDYRIIYSGDNFANIIFPRNLESDKIWEYVPFSFREKSRKEKFEEIFKKVFEDNKITVTDINEALRRWNEPKIQKAIKEAYNKVPGKANTNSLVLFSGVRDDRVYQVQFPIFNPSMQFVAKYSGCLYTGDYDASGKQKWNYLKKRLDNYWNYIGCVQVPHHGSYKNFNDELAEIDACFVISCGLKNQYKHPSGSVIKTLLLNNNYPNIVTENRDSEVIFDVLI